jgi:branched-chain amino acid transport system substrate-binding protein
MSTLPLRVVWKANDLLSGDQAGLVSASATADELTARGLATLNRTAWNDNEQATAAARFVSDELKFTRAAMVYDDTPYAHGLAQAFKAAFEQSGGAVTDFLMRNVGQSDYGEILNQIAANKPEIIYFAASPDVTTEFAAAKNDAGLQNVALMGADVLYPSLAGIGADAEGAYVSLVVPPQSAAVDDFVKRLEAQGGQPEHLTYSAPAYDALGLLAEALRQVAKVDGNGNLVIGRQALAQAVRATRGYVGLTGEITFDEKGDRASGAEVMVYQVQNGDWVQVFPAP